MTHGQGQGNSILFSYCQQLDSSQYLTLKGLFEMTLRPSRVLSLTWYIASGTWPFLRTTDANLDCAFVFIDPNIGPLVTSPLVLNIRCITTQLCLGL